MKAFLLSQGGDIWAITQDETYVVPPERTEPLAIARFERNNKAVNLLFAGLGTEEFKRVSHLETAREIWAKLKEHHEGTDAVKARLDPTLCTFEAQFTQKPGESVEEMFGRFQSVINKLRVNKCSTDHFPTDHEQALKLLHTLDPKVWETTASAIVEGASYDTLTTAQLFSKLKASEVDKQLRSTPQGGGSKSLALASAEGACANPSDSFALSSVSLLSISEEQLDTLGDDDLCLFNNRVRRVYDRRMAKKHGSKPGCFECGYPSHFVADCPKRNAYYTKGNGSGTNDSGGFHKQYDYKRRPRKGSRVKNFKKFAKNFHKETKHRERAFMAQIQEHLLDGYTSSSSSSSSSSDEEVVIKRGGKKDTGGPAGLCFMASSPERRSRHRTSTSSGFCTMALDGVEHKDPDSNDDTSSEVSMTDEEILEILEDNQKDLKRYAKITKKTFEAYERVSAELVIANGKIAALSAQVSEPKPTESEECESCLAVMADLAELRHRYAQRVDERDAFRANLEATKKELLAAQAPTVSDVEPCITCPNLESELERVKNQCEAQVRDLEVLGAELCELRARPTLLGACKVCPTLREELEQVRGDLEKWNTPSRTCDDCLSLRMELAACKSELKRLEKQPSHPCEECDACAAQAVLLSDLREEKENSESENFYLRQILSWVSAREP